MSAKNITLAAIALATLTFAPQSAQTQITETAPAVNVVGAAPVGRNMTMAFRTESMQDVTPVKGSPFCATVTNDHTQMFADGNRIHTTDDSLLCRDSQGRTRREAQLQLLGAVPQGTAPKIVTIEDPVAGVRYMLDTMSKTARKMPMGPTAIQTADGPKVAGNAVFFARSGSAEALPDLPPGGPVMISRRIITSGGVASGSDENPPATENLGDQTINGIHATGTRITTTIPAGKMGNEQPISVVSESWYSPDLKATVMTKHSDPWAGTLTTQFSNVNTSEPDPSLFTVPSDYKIVDDKAGPLMIKIQPPTTTGQ